MDNGATVLDILGGDNFIGLGRSSLSGQSLSGIFMNMKEKILAWKPDVIRLWNFPKEMKTFTVDSQKNMIAFSGSHFRLPLLLRVSDQRVEPLPESEYSAPLRFQLADFAPRDNFVWVDRCYKMGQLWAPELALSTDWCVSQGSWVVNRRSSTSISHSGKEKLPSETPLSIWSAIKAMSIH
jgi:phosphoglycerol transferase